MNRTIITLPETTETVLCLKLTGTISAEDYLAYFDRPLREMTAKYGFCNLCAIYADDFNVWSEEAADLSFKNISELGPKARKIAYVNAPDSRLLMMKMMGQVMSAQIRYFDTEQEREALDWITA